MIFNNSYSFFNSHSIPFIMTQTIQFNFSLLPWIQLIFLSRAAAQSAVQPVPTFASHQKWDPSMAAMVGALFCAFIFMGFFSVYLRHCSSQQSPSNGGDWPCSCSEGIDRKVLDTFPILVYSTIKDLNIGKEGDLECAVCLNEFKDCETLRLLPKCNHVFHPSCIEAWLTSHVTCPVCREKLNPDYDHVAITVTPELNVIGGNGNDENEEKEEEGKEKDGIFEGEDGENAGGGGGTVAVTGDRLGSTTAELRRSNSTGHCEVERCTLRLPEDVRRYILANSRRSASYDNVRVCMGGSPRKGLCRNEKDKEDLVHTPSLVA